jgi:hypothetical protein
VNQKRFEALLWRNVEHIKAAYFYCAFGGRGRDRTGDPLLAKQVLSQLSYTPTMGLVLMLKHLRSLANSENSLMTLYSVRIVTKPLLPEPRCAKTLGISLARRLIPFSPDNVRYFSHI